MNTRQLKASAIIVLSILLNAVVLCAQSTTPLTDAQIRQKIDAIVGKMKLQEKIDKQSIRRVRWYQKGADSVEIPIPVLGPDLMDPRRYAEIKAMAAQRPDSSAGDESEKA